MKEKSKIETIEERERKRNYWENTLLTFRNHTDKEHVKFVFEQAEKQLKDSVETSQVIVARTTTLLTLMAGLLVAVLSFLISKIEAKPLIYEIAFTSILFAVYIFWVCCCIASNVKGKSYYILGAEPKDLFVEGYYKNNADDEKRLIMYYVSQIIDYQQRIDYNKYLNETRWNAFHRSVWKVTLTPVALIVSYLTSLLFTKIFLS